MSEIAEQIREALDDMEGWDPDGSVMARTIRAVLDKCDRIEVDICGKPYRVGGFFADAFRSTIAEALGLSTPDSPTDGAA